MPPHHANIETSYRRTYKPETYHIAQEIQKYNIPDYRPRQEQYAASTSSTKAALTCFPPQIPESDQEGACGAAHAAEPWVRLQPDGERVAARPGAADTSLRHVEGGRAAVRVLNERTTRDAVFTGRHEHHLSTSYHYTDMYSTVAFAFLLIVCQRFVAAALVGSPWGVCIPGRLRRDLVRMMDSVLHVNNIDMDGNVYTWTGYYPRSKVHYTKPARDRMVRNRMMRDHSPKFSSAFCTVSSRFIFVVSSSRAATTCGSSAMYAAQRACALSEPSPSFSNMVPWSAAENA